MEERRYSLVLVILPLLIGVRGKKKKMKGKRRGLFFSNYKSSGIGGGKVGVDPTLFHFFDLGKNNCLFWRKGEEKKKETGLVFSPGGREGGKERDKPLSNNWLFQTLEKEKEKKGKENGKRRELSANLGFNSLLLKEKKRRREKTMQPPLGREKEMGKEGGEEEGKRRSPDTLEKKEREKKEEERKKKKTRREKNLQRRFQIRRPRFPLVYKRGKREEKGGRRARGKKNFYRSGYKKRSLIREEKKGGEGKGNVGRERLPAKYRISRLIGERKKRKKKKRENLGLRGQQSLPEYWGLGIGRRRKERKRRRGGFKKDRIPYSLLSLLQLGKRGGKKEKRKRKGGYRSTDCAKKGLSCGERRGREGSLLGRGAGTFH